MSDPRRLARTRLIVGPNASMSARQALGFFAGASVLSLGVAGAYAAVGFWPVLPFAGLELAAFGAALFVVLRRNRYREVLEFDGPALRVQFGLVGEGVRASCEWPRERTRVWIEAGPHRHSATRLVLACGEQRLVVGACLTDKERATLARRVKELIHPGWVEAGATVGPQPVRPT